MFLLKMGDVKKTHTDIVKTLQIVDTHHVFDFKKINFHITLNFHKNSFLIFENSFIAPFWSF